MSDQKRQTTASKRNTAKAKKKEEDPRKDPEFNPTNGPSDVTARRVLTDDERDRAQTLLRQKMGLIQQLDGEIRQIRGAMLGIIEAYDLTAEDANQLLGMKYFAEAETAAEEHKRTHHPEPTPEPDPVEPDEDIRD